MKTLRLLQTVLLLLLMPLPAYAESEFEQFINKALGGGGVQQQRAVRAGVKPADLIVANFNVTRQGHTVHYTATFRNIGQGPAGCFDYKVGDSAKGIRVEQVCPSSRWQLRPGEEIAVTGSVNKSEMWAWPDENGYNSKLYIIVNHGGKAYEEVINNNGSGKQLIRWGLD